LHYIPQQDLTINTSAMPSKPSTPPPALGTLIDNGALELVEILGYGGYGVVYRAVSTATSRYGSKPEQFAVKCLVHSQSQRHRQLHIREITLHRLASAHRNVVTLHRVIEDSEYTYIIMDYCPDGDLFSQILHHRRYLGYDALIKHVFLQLLDAVEHCHSLGTFLCNRLVSRHIANAGYRHLPSRFEAREHPLLRRWLTDRYHRLRAGYDGQNEPRIPHR
jgi:serine/threonine protein kinase